MADPQANVPQAVALGDLAALRAATDERAKAFHIGSKPESHISDIDSVVYLTGTALQIQTASLSTTHAHWRTLHSIEGPWALEQERLLAEIGAAGSLTAMMTPFIGLLESVVDERK